MGFIFLLCPSYSLENNKKKMNVTNKFYVVCNDGVTQLNCLEQNISSWFRIKSFSSDNNGFEHSLPAKRSNKESGLPT